MGMSRRGFVKLGALSTCGLAFGGALAGCSTGSAGSGSSADSDTSQVIVAMNKESEPAAGFDPLFSWGCGEHVHEPLIQSTLITTNTDLEFVNDLATGYQVSDDGMQWVFTIRDDVKFSDGSKLTAKDVAFTLNGILNSEGAEIDISMIDKAVATDDVTITIDMVRPCNSLLYSLAVIGIVPEATYDSATYGTHPIGSGRYLLEQWDQGQQAIFTANPDYYGEPVSMKRVVVVFMDESAASAACSAGQVDIAFTSATLSGQSISDYELFVCKTVDSRGISLPVHASGTAKADGDATYPCGNDVTADIAIRRAMNYGVDRGDMIDNVLSGYGAEAFSVGDGMPWSSPDMKVSTDVAKATGYLDDAGWVAGSDGIRSKDGLRASVDLYYSSSDSVRQALASDFSNQMKKLGIEVNIKGASWDDIYPHEYSDLILWGWGSNAPTEVYELYHSSGWGNYADYNSDSVDAYLDAAQATLAVEESYPLYQKAMWDGTAGEAPQGEATWVWLANVDHLYFKRDDLQVAAQKPHPHGHGWSLVNNVDQWSWS